MYYLKRNRERRPAAQNRPARRGPGMTFVSLGIAAAFIAVIKAKNPGLDIKPTMLMFGGVAFGCVIMALMAAKAKKDD